MLVEVIFTNEACQDAIYLLPSATFLAHSEYLPHPTLEFGPVLDFGLFEVPVDHFKSHRGCHLVASIALQLLKQLLFAIETRRSWRADLLGAFGDLATRAERHSLAFKGKYI